MSTKFAAVGNDGRRPVVWGVGDTEEEARAVARAALGELGDDVDRAAEVEAMTIHEITAEQAAVIEAGNVSWPCGSKST